MISPVNVFSEAAASFSLSCSSWANPTGERTSPAEKLATTVNFNHFEVRSGEYNMRERPPIFGNVNLAMHVIPRLAQRAEGRLSMTKARMTNDEVTMKPKCRKQGAVRLCDFRHLSFLRHSSFDL